MGRSPHWYQYVDAIPVQPSPGNVHETFDPLFNAALSEHTPPTIADPVLASGTAGFTFRVTSIMPLHAMNIDVGGILRCCSTYGMEEESSPVADGAACYRATHAVRYHLPFPVSDDSVKYDVFYVTRIDAPGVMCTWVIRSDGLVLNIESFQPLCVVRDVTIVT